MALPQASCPASRDETASFPNAQETKEFYSGLEISVDLVTRDSLNITAPETTFPKEEEMFIYIFDNAWHGF